MEQDEFEQAPIGEDTRLTSLQKRLNAANRAEEVRKGNEQGNGSGDSYRQGNRVLAELIGAPAGGALIGWVIDRLAGTLPLALLVFLFMGFVVAFRNIIRISTERPKQ